MYSSPSQDFGSQKEIGNGKEHTTDNYTKHLHKEDLGVLVAKT